MGPEILQPLQIAAAGSAAGRAVGRTLTRAPWINWHQLRFGDAAPRYYRDIFLASALRLKREVRGNVLGRLSEWRLGEMGHHLWWACGL